MNIRWMAAAAAAALLPVTASDALAQSNDSGDWIVRARRQPAVGQQGQHRPGPERQ